MYKFIKTYKPLELKDKKNKFPPPKFQLDQSTPTAGILKRMKNVYTNIYFFLVNKQNVDDADVVLQRT